MRVVVASDTIEGLTSAQAGRALAAGWSSAEVSVLPVGEAGAGFLTALADSAGVAVATSGWSGAVVSTVRGPGWAAVQVEGAAATGPIPYAATSRPLGEALAELLRSPTPPGEPEPVDGPRLYVDLAGLAVHDGGAGLLAGLGATASGELGEGVRGLAGLTDVDLSPARELLGAYELVGVVPADQLTQPMLGLRGITSRAGRSAGAPTEELLTTDSVLAHFAALAGSGSAGAPGAGACGGLGFAVLALGGRLTTGSRIGLGRDPFARADLVVTGCSEFDFATRGGGVVAAVAEAAGRALSPCVAIAGQVVIGSREMRTMGIDAAYAVRHTHPTGATAAAVAATAQRVARSWSW